MSEELELLVASDPSTSMVWLVLNGNSAEMLGLVPTFMSVHSEEPAAVQLDANYRHGGGWRPMKGFTLHGFTDDDLLHGRTALHYEGDPPYKAVGVTMLRDETIILFDYGFAAVVQADGSYEVARLD